MTPFGETLRLWRGHRGLTQAQVAQRARISQPAVSAMEQDRREISLSTLRALAIALEVQPGVLADGTPPPALARRLTRPALERIADAVVFGTPTRRPAERELARLLAHVLRQRRRLTAGLRGRVRRGIRQQQQAWLQLHAAYSRALITSLLQRIAERQRLHATQTD